MLDLLETIAGVFGRVLWALVQAWDLLLACFWPTGDKSDDKAKDPALDGKELSSDAEHALKEAGQRKPTSGVPRHPRIG
jgi:hypothetical protein